ncbi:hypothetical protein FHR24_000702 [Wenyingzhuangia heitensis]|uniref:DUF2911 domain-containing protein n=1 Tax=Wenyingzhuangia heitensis TaxID=1487859 RepID=A0ABX0U5Y9_9FLAO|nr:DUF2911 domain-containing protein [Wenyingzhuangia heitensis]NIJ44263.1 hypothetical protein [Wenyingzhuangia heitensis]
MKKVVVFFAMVLCGFTVSAQNFKGLDVSPMDAISYPLSYKTSDKVVKIIYSRPQLKGRTVDALAKNGKVWRVGANEATEVIFYNDVVFGGKKVKAGTYSLFAIPDEKEWTIILNNDLNVWGAYSYSQEKDVLRVTAKTSKNEESIEAFTMAFDKEMNLYIAWGTTLVTLPMSEK